MEALRADPAGLSINWLGHATVDLVWGRTRIVTDPVLRRRVGHLVRRRGTSDLAAGKVDLVVISHLHHDHLDVPSLRQLGPDLALAVPWGSGSWIARQFPARGVPDIVEMAPGNEITVGDVAVTAVPAEHQRGRFARRVRGEPYGVMIHRGAPMVYFPGDTDLHPVMADLPSSEVALLPIWGWGPTLGPGHLDPARAAVAARTLRARRVLPIHWGTFSPVGMGQRRRSWLEAPRERFAQALSREAPDTEWLDIGPGEGSWRWSQG
jgi:L-ascorbate metabolism protein UlaG (beta-lactamase superfamily)